MKQNRIEYSIIIPTFNEEKFIEKILLNLERQIDENKNNVEIIIVDGGSSDRTIELCYKYNVSVIHSEKGRGKQLKIGGEKAIGKYLMFFHADSILPENTISFVENNFDSSSKAASFRMKFDDNNLLYKIYSFFTKFDTMFTTFGDQGLVIENSFYKELGGFKNLAIMEDVEFFIRLRKEIKIKKFNKFITSSSRKFDRNGKIKNQLRNLYFITRYLLGTSTDTLYNKYYNHNYDKKKGSNYICKIPEIRESQNQIGLNNK